MVADAENRRGHVDRARSAVSAANGGGKRSMVRLGGSMRKTLVRRPAFGGLAGGVVFWWFSLVPSLLPRSWIVQAVVSAVCVLVGYGLGSVLGWLVHLSFAPRRAQTRCPTPARCVGDAPVDCRGHARHRDSGMAEMAERPAGACRSGGRRHIRCPGERRRCGRVRVGPGSRMPVRLVAR